MDGIGSNALIVEGGAMRGIFSCGVLDHFITHDFSPFDSFWGVSAGASNLAAYLANMPGRNKKIYLDYSCRPQFIRIGDFLRGGDLLNLDWMWSITLDELGIDKVTLAADARPFFLGVTHQATGQAEYHTPDVEQLADTMKASSAVPILYRHGVLLGQHRYVDGGVTDAIPVMEAIRRGAKNIMIIRSRPSHYQKLPVKYPSVMKFLLRRTPALIKPMLSRAERYNQTLALIASPPKGVRIVEICPPDSFHIKRLSRDQTHLEESYQLGLKAGGEAMRQWRQQISGQFN